MNINPTTTFQIIALGVAVFTCYWLRRTLRGVNRTKFRESYERGGVFLFDEIDGSGEV